MHAGACVHLSALNLSQAGAVKGLISYTLPPPPTPGLRKRADRWMCVWVHAQAAHVCIYKKICAYLSCCRHGPTWTRLVGWWGGGGGREFNCGNGDGMGLGVRNMMSHN